MRSIRLHFDQVARCSDSVLGAPLGQASAAAAPDSSTSKPAGLPRPSSGISDAAALLGRALGLAPSAGERKARAAQVSVSGLLQEQTAPGVTLRDEVWFRVLALQRRSEGDQVAATVPVRAERGQLHYEPPRCWGRAANCRRLPKSLRPAAAASKARRRRFDVAELGDVAQVVRPTDILKMQKQQLEAFEAKREALTSEWRRGEMSNFAYLMALNALAGRSFEDLSQYPVMPWVCMHLWCPDQPSTVLSNGDSAMVSWYFRDVSRTLGDVGDEERRQNIQEKFRTLKEQDCVPYHYGTHYSTPAFAMHFLLRVQPFNQLARALQGGRYDVADRIFWSLKESWRSCSTEMSDVRELTPELFSMPESLINISGIDFGTRQDGLKVGHVDLPDWARDAYHFIHEHRLALESPYVSQKLAGWIDLVFGVKQRGKAALEALNVFYPLTYEEGAEWDKTEPHFRHCKEQQVLHFGQTPPQVFREAHPVRDRRAHSTPSLFQHEASEEADLCRWHSSAASATSLVYEPLHVSAAPVVAMALHTPLHEPARLYLLKASGVLSIHRASHPQFLPGASVSRVLSMPSLQDAKEELTVSMEASFGVPRTADEVYERLLAAEHFRGQPNCWALLAEPLFFARGGYRDGTIVYGRPKKDEHCSAIVQAHACMVTAIAVSQACAQWVEGSHGLVLMAGSADGVVSLWTAGDSSWHRLLCLTRCQSHLDAVQCIDFNDAMGFAATGGEDGLIHVYTMKPLQRVLRTFAMPDRESVAEVRFGSRAPATIVAASKAPSRICVWSLQGYVLAELVMPETQSVQSLRVLDDCDAQEALLCATNDGSLQLMSLPYLQRIWGLPCYQGSKPSVLSSSQSRRIAWVGHQDGTFEAIYAKTASGGTSPGHAHVAGVWASTTPLALTP